MESLFVPLCIYNNTEGDDDARVRKMFDEPAWNNPVVRILDARRKDLTGRIHDAWTVQALALGMKEALENARKRVPPYLGLLAAEEQARSRGTVEVVFGMG